MNRKQRHREGKLKRKPLPFLLIITFLHFPSLLLSYFPLHFKKKLLTLQLYKLNANETTENHKINYQP